MATNTRSRSSEDQWRDMEIRIQELQVSCQKQIEISQSGLENKILSRIDQMMSMVANCDAKIESCNAKLEDKINTKMAGLLKSLNLERTVGRDGEIFKDKGPLLQTPNHGH